MTPVHNVAPPVPATVAPQVGSGGTLFTDPPATTSYAVEGQTLAAQGTSPQLDILVGHDGADT